MGTHTVSARRGNTRGEQADTGQEQVADSNRSFGPLADSAGGGSNRELEFVESRQTVCVA